MREEEASKPASCSASEAAPSRTTTVSPQLCFGEAPGKWRLSKCAEPDTSSRLPVRVLLLGSMLGVKRWIYAVSAIVAIALAVFLCFRDRLYGTGTMRRL